MRHLPPDVLMEVLSLVKGKVPAGVQVTEEDIEKASEMVYVTHLIETIEWKLEHITIENRSV